MKTITRIVLSAIFSAFFIAHTACAQKAYITYGLTTNKGIKVVNTNTNTVIDSIAVTQVGPDAVVTSPDGSRAFVTYYGNSGNQVISVINTATNTIINNYVVTQGGDGGDGIDITPDGTTLYYPNIFGNHDTVYALNALTGAVKAKIALPTSGVEGLAINPNGQEVYVALGNTVQVIKTATNTLSTPITVAGASGFIYGLAVSPDGSKVYAAVSENGGYVTVVNANTKSIAANILVDPVAGHYTFGIAVSPDGTKAYATNRTSGKLAIINAVNNTLIDTVAAGVSPYGIAVTKDGSKVYVANQDVVGAVTVLSTLNNSIIATIPSGYASVAFGKFIAEPLVGTGSGSLQVPVGSGPTISNNFFNNLTNGGGQLVAQINPNNNNLGSIGWGARKYAGTDIQNTYGWFGGATKQYGAFLRRNIYITPVNQPASANTVRIFCSDTDIQDFITSFNSQYGTTKTINDIRIIKYNGANVDLSWANNDDIGSKYISIVPTAIGAYDYTNEFKFFEFPVSSYSEFWLALTSATGTMPLHLISFTGRKEEGKTVLNWVTENEMNTSSFDIEKSTDAAGFAKIGGIKASVNNLKQNTYAYTDSKISTGKSFYRLKMIDKDGKFSYSKIITISNLTDAAFRIYPNPVAEVVNLQLLKPMSGEVVKITDATGKIVKISNIKSESTSVSIDVSTLANGVYTISVGINSAQFIKK